MINEHKGKKLGGVLLSSITRNRNRKKEGQNNKDGVIKAKKLECTHRVGFALYISLIPAE